MAIEGGKHELIPLVLFLAACVTPNVAQAEVSAESLAQSSLIRAEQVGSIDSLEVLKTSLGSAQREASQYSPPPTEDGTTPVYIVAMHGQFIDTLAPYPHADPAPAGSIMTFTYSAATGEEIESYVGNDPPQVGTVTLKTDAPTLSGKMAAKVARARIARARRRATAKAATWGNKCSAGEGHHCYALSEWDMGEHEAVEGTENWVITNTVDVPDWELGDITTNEEWVGFPGYHWIVMVNMAGNDINCCSIYGFWAMNNGGGFREHILWEKPLGQWSDYSMMAAGSGIWCTYVGEYRELGEGCEGGFETYGKDLESGAEMGDEAAPYNLGWTEVNGFWLNGERHNWNFAKYGLYNETGNVSYNGMCWAPYSPYPATGNIYYGSSGACP